MKLPGWARNALTEGDDETYDLLRILACLGVAEYLGLALVKWQAFDPQSFGIGFGAVLLAAGGAIRLNEGPRPGNPPDGPTTTVTADRVTIKP